MDPGAGVPSGRLFRVVLTGFGLCVVAGIWLLVASPRLPGEAAGGASRAQTSATPPGGPDRGSSTAPSATPAASGTAASARSYTVQPGDTLASIANAIGVSPASIIQLNPTIDPNNLQIGQTLRLPVLQAP